MAKLILVDPKSEPYWKQYVAIFVADFQLIFVTRLTN